MSQYTKKDLEIEFHFATGTDVITNGSSSKQREFYNWCIEQLLIYKNKERDAKST